MTTADDRRTQILEATERLLGRGGVEAVTMRAVAAEAGVSLRLVQYYGRSKDELLSATLDRLAAKSVHRWRARTAGAGGVGTPVEEVRAFFAEALPTDEPSRAFHRVGVSLEVLAVTGSAAAGDAYRRHLSALAEHLAGRLATGGLAAAKATAVALEVMALGHGLGTLVMAGVSTTAQAQAVAAEYTERLQRRLSG